MRRFTGISVLCVLAWTVSARGTATTQPDSEAKVDQHAVAAAVAAGLVRVEYTLQFDKGEVPPSRWGNDGATVIRDERPMEYPGFLLSATQVLTVDTVLHPRFVKKTEVRFGQQVVGAKPMAYSRWQYGTILQLDAPLKDARPLSFDPNAAGPYAVVTYGLGNAQWGISVENFPSSLVVTEKQEEYSGAPWYCLVTDGGGKPVGMTMNGRFADDSWKGSPLDWPVISAGEMAEGLARLERKTDEGILRVSLNFRSPNKAAKFSFRDYNPEGRGGGETERNVLGVLVSPNRILVLADLKSNMTSRLEQIQVYPPDGKPVSAKFAGTLTDYGAFLADLERPLPGPIEFSQEDISNQRCRLLMNANIRVLGEKRFGYYSHARFYVLELGWKRRVFPDHSSRTSFAFTEGGQLLLLPLQRRDKIEAEETPRARAEDDMVPVAYIKPVLDDPVANFDSSNVPVTEAQENRLAWMGVELQPLDRDLARSNKVSDQTKDGKTGAIVSYVYPDSPAARVGIEPGFILLRLHVADQPVPLEVKLDESPFAGGQFPWDKLDEVPEQYLSQIPAPWPPAESNFTRALTELGFGKKYQAEFYHDGQIILKDFEVVESPPHFDAAPRYKSKELGVTVRDLTYEVRRFYQRSPQDPGVIVSKVEPGSKAAVSKIMPYEIITHVNDQPVADVKDFEKLIAGQSELRLEVKRMSRGRVVKVKLAPTTQSTLGAKSQSASAPAKSTVTE